MADPCQTLTRLGGSNRSIQRQRFGGQPAKGPRPPHVKKEPRGHLSLQSLASLLAEPMESPLRGICWKAGQEIMERHRSPVTSDPSNHKGSDLTRGLIKVPVLPPLFQKSHYIRPLPRIKISGKVRGNRLVRSQKAHAHMATVIFDHQYNQNFLLTNGTVDRVKLFHRKKGRR